MNVRKSTRKDGSSSRRLASNRIEKSVVEALENRVLFAANVWKAAVSGSWGNDTIARPRRAPSRSS
jgi:hypothetical protein